MIGNVNCSILQMHNLTAAVVVFWRDMEGGVASFEPLAVEDGTVQYGWKEYDEGAVPQGAFRIPMPFARLGVIQQLVDEIAKEFKVVASGMQEAKSKEQAVQAHLEDLQKLLFTSDWIELQRGDVKIVKEERDDAAV